MADLWLVGEMVNRIGIYGSKVAEGLSAFQRRSCCCLFLLLVNWLYFNLSSCYYHIFVVLLCVCVCVCELNHKFCHWYESTLSWFSFPVNGYFCSWVWSRITKLCLPPSLTNCISQCIWGIFTRLENITHVLDILFIYAQILDKICWKCLVHSLCEHNYCENISLLWFRTML